jgi:putative tricarboxylic transport membrane protein
VILLTMEERLAPRDHAAGISLRVVLTVGWDLPKYWLTLLRILHRLLARNHAGGATAASSMGYNPAKRFSNERPGRGGVGQVPRSISALSTTTQRIVSFL